MTHIHISETPMDTITSIGHPALIYVVDLTQNVNSSCKYRMLINS